MKTSQLFRANLVRSAFGSLAAAGGGQIALMVSGVIVARLLGPENRGYFALITLLPVIVSQIIVFGAKEAVAYYLARDPGSAVSLLRHHYVVGIVQAIVGTSAYAIVCALVFYNDPRTVMLGALVTIPATAAAILQLYGYAVLQGLRDFRTLNVIRLFPAGTFAVLLLPAFILRVDSVFTISLLWTAGTLINSAVLTVAVARSLSRISRRHPSTAKRRDILSFGAKSFLGSASPLETFRLDQAVTGLFLSPYSLGIYVTAAAFTNFPRLIAQSISIVAYPHIAAYEEPLHAIRATWKFVLASIGLSLPAVAVGVVLADWAIRLFFGHQFAEAVTPARVLMVAALFHGSRRVLGEALRGMNMPVASSVGELVGWISLAIFMLLLAPQHGVLGVAYSVLASSIAGLFVLVIFIRSTTRVQSGARPNRHSLIQSGPTKVSG